VTDSLGQYRLQELAEYDAETSSNYTTDNTMLSVRVEDPLGLSQNRAMLAPGDLRWAIAGERNMEMANVVLQSMERAQIMDAPVIHLDGEDEKLISKTVAEDCLTEPVVRRKK
jgi:hypothetical protein